MDQSQITTIAQQFVQSYYQTFDTNRANLAAIYVRARTDNESIIVILYDLRGWHVHMPAVHLIKL